MSDHRREEDLAELATGAVTGAERAVALRHVVSCPDCLRELAQLSRTADELLVLAPLREPPAGFESVVLAHIAAGDPPNTPGHRFLRSLAIAMLAAAIGAAAVWQATAGDREAGRDQRPAAQVSPHVTARPILAGDGTSAGTVFLYDGDPAWLMLILAGVPVDGAYQIVVHYHDGTSSAGEWCQVDRGEGTDGDRLLRPIGALASVELIGPGGVRLAARF
jgi:hypothetical protein